VSSRNPGHMRPAARSRHAGFLLLLLDKQHVSDAVRFYTPSALERKWAALVGNLRPTACDDWLQGRPLFKEMAALANASKQLAKPSLVRKRHCDSNASSCETGIEPLVSSLRNPLAMLKDCSAGGCNHTEGRADIMSKSWLMMPRHLQPSLRQAGGRLIFFDLGAGTNAGADNRGSLAWFARTFHKLGSPIQHIIAWEAAVIEPQLFWDSIQPSVVPRLQFYNVPADPTPNGTHNPWRVLTAIVRSADYVVVKIDVDNSAVELALVLQLLESESYHRRVDELFWEHHVAGSPMQCPQLWGGKPRSGEGWSAMTFNTSNVHETLAGSYALFRRLRALGIRAHSWV